MTKTTLELGVVGGNFQFNIERIAQVAVHYPYHCPGILLRHQHTRQQQAIISQTVVTLGRSDGE